MSAFCRKLVCSTCLVFSLLATVPLADAAVLEVGVQGIDQLPIALGDPHTGHYEGFARELLDDFAVRHGHQLHYRPLPRSQNAKPGCLGRGFVYCRDCENCTASSRYRLSLLALISSAKCL